MISTPSDLAATTGVREWRRAVPAGIGTCPARRPRFPPTERNATRGSFRERYGGEDARAEQAAGLVAVMLAGCI
jgi:hypothetical protein